MSLFRKIKNLFYKENSPIPSTDDFIKSDRKEVDQLIRELGLEETKPSVKSTNTSIKAERGQGKGKKNNPSVNIGDLFFEEGEVDLDELNEKSRQEAERSAPGSGSGNTSSTDAFKEKIEEKIRNTGEKIKEKGEDLKEKMDNFLDDVGKKSARLDEIERQEKEKYSGPMDYRGKSMLDDKDDFFEKAKAYAEGRPFPPEGMSIEITDPEPDQKQDKRKVYGFDDLDGDGDEIIDDAILEEE